MEQKVSDSIKSPQHQNSQKENIREKLEELFQYLSQSEDQIESKKEKTKKDPIRGAQLASYALSSARICTRILSIEEQKSISEEIKKLHLQEKACKSNQLENIHLTLFEKYQLAGNDKEKILFYGVKIYENFLKKKFRKKDENLGRILDAMIFYLEISFEEKPKLKSEQLKRISNILLVKPKFFKSDESEKFETLSTLVNVHTVHDHFISEDDLSKTESFLKEFLPKISSSQKDIIAKHPGIASFYIKIQIYLVYIKNGEFRDKNFFEKIKNSHLEFPIVFLLNHFHRCPSFKNQKNLFVLFREYFKIIEYISAEMLQQTTQLALIIFYFEHFFKIEQPEIETITNFQKTVSLFDYVSNAFQFPSLTELAKPLQDYYTANKNSPDINVIRRELRILIQMINTLLQSDVASGIHNLEEWKDAIKKKINSSPYTRDLTSGIHSLEERKDVIEKKIDLSSYPSKNTSQEKLVRKPISINPSLKEINNPKNNILNEKWKQIETSLQFIRTSKDPLPNLSENLIGLIQLLDPAIFSQENPQKKWIEELIQINKQRSHSSENASDIQKLITAVGLIRELETRALSQSLTSISTAEHGSFIRLNALVEEISSKNFPASLRKLYYFSHCLYIYIQWIRKFISSKDNADDLFFLLKITADFIKKIQQKIDLVDIGVYYLLREISHHFYTIREKMLVGNLNIQISLKKEQWNTFIDSILELFKKTKESLQNSSNIQKTDELKIIYILMAHFTFENMKTDSLDFSNDWKDFITLFISHGEVLLKEIKDREIKKISGFKSDPIDFDIMLRQIRAKQLVTKLSTYEYESSRSPEEGSSTLNIPTKLTNRTNILSAIQRVEKTAQTNFTDAHASLQDIFKQIQFLDKELSADEETKCRQKIQSFLVKEKTWGETPDLISLGYFYTHLAKCHHALGNDNEMIFYGYLASHLLISHYKNKDSEGSIHFSKFMTFFIRRYIRKYPSCSSFLVNLSSSLTSSTPSFFSKKLKFLCLIYIAYYEKDLKKRKAYVNYLITSRSSEKEMLFDSNEIFEQYIKLLLENLAMNDREFASISQKELESLAASHKEKFSTTLIRQEKAPNDLPGKIFLLKKTNLEKLFENLIRHINSSKTLDFDYIRETIKDISVFLKQDNKKLEENKSKNKIKSSTFKKKKNSTKKIEKKIVEETPSKKSRATQLKELLSTPLRRKKIVVPPQKTQEKSLQHPGKIPKRSASVINIRKYFENKSIVKNSTSEKQAEEKSPSASPRSQKPKLTRTYSLNKFLGDRDEKRLSINSLNAQAITAINQQITLLEKLLENRNKNKYKESAFYTAIRIHLFRIFQLSKNLSETSEYSFFTTNDRESNSLRNLFAYRQFNNDSLVQLSNTVIRGFRTATLDKEAFHKTLLESSKEITENYKTYFTLIEQQYETLYQLLQNFSTRKKLKAKLSEDEEFLWICLCNLTSLSFLYRKFKTLPSFKNPFDGELQTLLDKCNFEFRNPIAHQTKIDFTGEKIADLSRILLELKKQFEQEFGEEVEEENEITPKKG